MRLCTAPRFPGAIVLVPYSWVHGVYFASNCTRISTWSFFLVWVCCKLPERELPTPRLRRQLQYEPQATNANTCWGRGGMQQRLKPMSGMRVSMRGAKTNLCAHTNPMAATQNTKRQWGGSLLLRGVLPQKGDPCHYRMVVVGKHFAFLLIVVQWLKSPLNC